MVYHVKLSSFNRELFYICTSKVNQMKNVFILIAALILISWTPKRIFVTAIQYKQGHKVMIDTHLKFIEKKNGHWFTDKGKRVYVIFYRLTNGLSDEWVDGSYLDY